MADEALTGDLTDADRDYARRWAAARGVRPWPRDWMGDDGWRWLRFGAGSVPGSVWGLLPGGRLTSEAAAWDALAAALKRVRADAAIPGETWVRVVDAGPLQPFPLPDDE